MPLLLGKSTYPGCSDFRSHIYVWLTQITERLALDAILGFGSQTTSNTQWYLSHDNVANTLRFRVPSGNIKIPITDGAPTLITAHFDRLSTAQFRLTIYKGAANAGSLSLAYPFNSPPNEAVATRNIGQMGGFPDGWTGTVHRLQLIKVPPAFNIAKWLAAEIAANAARWI